MAEKPSNSIQIVKKISRAELLNISSWVVENMKGRLSKARFIEQRGDPIKLQYFRVLVQAIQAHNAILKDDQLDDIEKRLAALESTDNNNSAYRPRERERE